MVAERFATALLGGNTVSLPGFAELAAGAAVGRAFSFVMHDLGLLSTQSGHWSRGWATGAVKGWLMTLIG